MNTDSLSEALDQLYAAPLERFVALRREFAARLRSSGDAAASKTIGSAAKPTRTAWALNQVAHRRPEVLSALFESWNQASATQKRGDADEVRASVRAYRERLADVVQAARAAAAEVGVTFGAEQARRIGETLQAASVSGSEARASLVAGRLVQDVAVEDPFAGLAAGPVRGRSEKEPHEQQERQARQARQAKIEAIDRGRDQVATLEHQAAEARAAAREANAVARRAQSEADRAARAAAEAEQRLEHARAELQRLKA